jgi:hypothetical protein
VYGWDWWGFSASFSAARIDITFNPGVINALFSVTIKTDVRK